MCIAASAIPDDRPVSCLPRGGKPGIAQARDYAPVCPGELAGTDGGEHPGHREGLVECDSIDGGPIGEVTVSTVQPGPAASRAVRAMSRSSSGRCWG